jgi:hypothetical protein
MAKVGRKGWKEELELKKVAQLSERVLIKALEAKEEEVSLKEKINIAQTLYVKFIPRDFQHSGEIKGQNPQIIIVRNKKEAEKIKNERDNRVQSDGETG